MRRQLGKRQRETLIALAALEAAEGVGRHFSPASVGAMTRPVWRRERADLLGIIGATPPAASLPPRSGGFAFIAVLASLERQDLATLDDAGAVALTAAGRAMAKALKAKASDT